MVSKGQCVATIESLVARWLEHPTRPRRMWAQIPSGSRIFFRVVITFNIMLLLFHLKYSLC